MDVLIDPAFYEYTSRFITGNAENTKPKHQTEKFPFGSEWGYITSEGIISVSSIVPWLLVERRCLDLARPAAQEPGEGEQEHPQGGEQALLEEEVQGEEEESH